jgi:uncharacterized protein YegL
MANEKLTDITFILDRSGSMESIRNDTIGGFNAFLDAQTKAPGEAVVTLVQFDNEYEVDYQAVSAKLVRPLDSESFVPRGATALNDAIGRTVTETGKRLAAMAEKDRPGKVMIIIMTDGAENASTDYKGPSGIERIKKMIEHQKDVYSWAFLFLGANLNAQKTSTGYGIGAGNAMQYAAHGAGTKAVLRGAARGVASWRGTRGKGDNKNFASSYVAPEDIADANAPSSK